MSLTCLTVLSKVDNENTFPSSSKNTEPHIVCWDWKFSIHTSHKKVKKKRFTKAGELNLHNFCVAR